MVRVAELNEVQTNPEVVDGIRRVVGESGLRGAIEEMHRRLVKAGWRPGMTAEDAARLLAEVRDGS